MANRNANKGNAIKTEIAQTETILPNDQLNDQKTEIMQDQTDAIVSDQTDVNGLPQTDAIVSDQTDAKTDDKKEDSDVTPERTKEDILNDIVKEKMNLRTIEDKFENDPENEEITKQEIVISKLKDELKDYKKIEEKNRLRSEYNAKYAIAFNDLKDKLSLSDDTLNGLIANAKDDQKKDTLKSSFEIVFGKIPVFIAENVKGTSLNKSSANSDNKPNLAKMIKEMIVAGNSQDEIVSAIQENSDLDLTKSKKRYTDTKWQYEQSLKK